MSLLLTFTAALTEVYWPTNITPSWGKSKICVAHQSTLKGPAVKGKEKSPPSTKNDWTMVHIFCAAKWLCTCNRSPARSRSSHYSHYCDDSSLGGIQLHHGTGPASSVSCYDGARVLCCVASLCFSQDSPVLFFWKLNGSSMSWLLAHIRSYFMHYINQNQNHPIITSGDRQGWLRSI